MKKNGVDELIQKWETKKDWTNKELKDFYRQTSEGYKKGDEETRKNLFGLIYDVLLELDKRQLLSPLEPGLPFQKIFLKKDWLSKGGLTDMKRKIVVAQELETMGPIIVEEPATPERGEILVPDDKEWSTPKEFLVYLRGWAKRVPPFKRENGPSMERAIGYYNKVLREVSNVLRSDAEDVNLTLDELQEIQDIRNEILKQIERIDEIKNKLDVALRRGEEKGKMVKEATTPVITTVKTPFIFDLARDIVNARVSSGRNMEELFKRASDEFKLNQREKVELVWTLKDMGWPLHQAVVFDYAPENYHA